MKVTCDVVWPPPGTLIHASVSAVASRTRKPTPKRALPGLVSTMSSTAALPAKVEATGRRCKVRPRKVPCVMCIETMPLPASRKVST